MAGEMWWRSVVVDTTDCRGLAEFYRGLLGWEYEAGFEPPPPGEPDPWGEDWLVLLPPGGVPRLAFQQVEALPASTWPGADVPQQLHLDLAVHDRDTLREKHERALQLGARVLHDGWDEDEAIYVYADPSGHPFCIFVHDS